MELEPLDRAHHEEATASVRGVFGFQRAVTLPDLWLPVFLAVALCRPNEAPAETVAEKPPGSGGLSGQFVIRPADPLASSRQAINLAFIPISARSLSGQFLIHDERSTHPYASPLNLNTDRGFVRIEPTFLAVSCERIKQVLLREIGDSGPWRGKVFLALHDSIDPRQMITITSKQVRDGLNHRMDLAD